MKDEGRNAHLKGKVLRGVINLAPASTKLVLGFIRQNEVVLYTLTMAKLWPEGVRKSEIMVYVSQTLTRIQRKKLNRFSFIKTFRGVRGVAHTYTLTAVNGDLKKPFIKSTSLCEG